MAKALPATKVITGKVRFSYAHVFKPASIIEGGDLKYSVAILIDKKDKETLAKINKALEAAKQAGAAMWGGKVPAILKMPLRDGDEERGDQEEYKGCYFLNAASNQKPGVVNSNLDPILDPSEFYSGCYGKASLNFYAFNQAGNRGIAVGLNNLMKTADGVSLSGLSDPRSDFADEVEDDDDLF